MSVHLLRALACCVVMAAGRAATSAAPRDAGVTPINLAGQVEIARLVDLASQRLGLNIDYDPAALKGSFTLRSENGLTDAELWDLVNRVLASRGMTAVANRVDSAAMYSVVNLSDAPALATISDQAPASSLLTCFPPGFQSVVISLNHRSATDCVTELSRLLPKSSGGVVALADDARIVVTDLTPRIEQIRRLLESLDREGAGPARLEYRPVNLAPPHLSNAALQVATRLNAAHASRFPGDLIPLPDGETLLLLTTQGRLDEWKVLLGTLDRREPVETATYSPRHFAPKDVARLIEQTVRDGGLGGSGAGGGAGGGGSSIIGSSRGASGGVGGAAGGGNAAAGIGGLGVADDRWRLVVDDLTGSLLITATPRQHEAIRALMQRLDDVPAAARRPMRTFTVKNRPVNEIVAIIDQLVQSGALHSSGSDATGGDSRAGASMGAAPDPRSGATLPLRTSTAASAAPAASSSSTDVLSLPPPPTTPGTPSQAAVADLRSSAASASNTAARPTSQRGGGGAESPLTLTIDKGTSTIIAVGEPRILDQIEALIRSLDVRQPQVMLEVLLVTLSDGQTLDLGVELEKLEISGDIRTRLSSLFGLGARGSGGDRDGPANASGFTGVVLSPGDFSIVLRALETLNNGRSMSMPKLLVGNNESATLDSVVQQPFASVNASNTVSTTSFGGTQDAGTVVTIQPQIAEGDHLLLEYSVSLSSFLGPASSPTLPPPRQQNRVQSVATIPDSFTVVVGGIELENKSEAISQIPLLGSIPLIGEAFKSRANTKNRSRFYVFIRDNVMRHGGFEDLKYVSGTDAAGAGVGDGWPELKPRVIR